MNSFIDNPKSGRRESQKNATRARLLEVARDHFARHGFEAASVRGIARDARVAVGTVLLHFADKRDLLNAALEGELKRVIESALAAPRRGPVVDRLETLARAFFGFYTEHPTLSKTLLREALLAEPPWRERFTAQVTRVHGHIVEMLESVADPNESRRHVRALAGSAPGAELSPPVTGAAFFAFYYFALIGWVQGAVTDPNALFSAMLRQHLRVPAQRPPRRPKTPTKTPSTRRKR